MKIHEVIRLRNVYGGETTLNDLVSDNGYALTATNKAGIISEILVQQG